MRNLASFQHNHGFQSSAASSSEYSQSRYNEKGDLLAVGNRHGFVKIFGTGEDGHLLPKISFKAHEVEQDWRFNQQNSAEVIGIQFLNSDFRNNRLFTTNGQSLKLWQYYSFPSRYLTSEAFVPKIHTIENNIHKVKLRSQWQLPLPHSIKQFNLNTLQDRMLLTNGYEVYMGLLDKLPHFLQVSNNHAKAFKFYIPGQPSGDFSGQQFKNQIEADIFQIQQWNSIPGVCSARFHNEKDNCFAYSTKLAEVLYVDNRTSTSTRPSISFGCDLAPSVLKRTLQAVSDLGFLSDGHSIISRDYLYTYLWDMRKPNVMVNRSIIFPSISKLISRLYEQGNLTDLFPLAVSPSGKVLTPHYNWSFHEIDPFKNENIRYSCKTGKGNIVSISNPEEEGEFQTVKTSNVIYSPGENAVCAASGDRLTVFK